MPERPDLDYAVPILRDALVGRTVVGVRIRKPVVLRLAVAGTAAGLLVGQRFIAVARRAHFVRFALDPPAGATRLELVVAPMLAGRFALAGAGERAPGDLALAIELEGGRELRYRDDVQMGKVYVLAAGDDRAVPGLDAAGVDALDPEAFDRASFRALARGRRDQAKVFLMDKRAIDSLGNAYADESLWAAGIHPKTWVRDLDEVALERLRAAIADVLGRAAAELAARRPPIDVKLRDFLAVRGRHKQPCPRCGTAIRKAGVHGHDAVFCPSCQPETRRGSIVDWRKAPRPGQGDERTDRGSSEAWRVEQPGARGPERGAGEEGEHAGPGAKPELGRRDREGQAEREREQRERGGPARPIPRRRARAQEQRADEELGQRGERGGGERGHPEPLPARPRTEERERAAPALARPAKLERREADAIARAAERAAPERSRRERDAERGRRGDRRERTQPAPGRPGGRRGR
jgi:formamidopyrimidine-DNA glycosylase